MFLNKIIIENQTLVRDIVRQYYPAANVFRKYGIEYCCGGKWPLETVCINNGLQFEEIRKELEQACRTVQLPSLIEYGGWSTDFLTSYIVNVHHQFLKKSLPATEQIVKEFADGHVKQYPYMQEVLEILRQLTNEILPHIKYEEETIFPYICQIARAYENNDSFAKLLVKTLSKPLDMIMQHEEHTLTALVIKMRILTGNYIAPEKACVSHVLSLSRLKELDDDLMQHIYLENQILFPRALRIEVELLK